MSNDARGIGERLKELRKDQKLSLEELAASTGFSRQVLASIERGEQVDHSQIEKLAKEMNVSLGWLLRGETLADRLRDRRKELQLSQGKLAEAAGLTQPTISSLEKGESKSSGSIASLARALRVNALWLQTGLGEKEEQATVGFRRIGDGDECELEFDIPLIEAPGNCGNVYGSSSSRSELYEAIAKKETWFRRHGIEPGKVFAMFADGNSMANFIMNGDLMFFKEAEDHPKSSTICAIETTDGLRINRVHKRADGGILLSSDNPDKTLFPDETYSADDAAKIVIRGHFVSREG